MFLSDRINIIWALVFPFSSSSNIERIQPTIMTVLREFKKIIYNFLVLMIINCIQR